MTVVRSSTTDVVEVEAPPTDEVKEETKVPFKPPRSALQIVVVNRIDHLINSLLPSNHLSIHVYGDVHFVAVN